MSDTVYGLTNKGPNIKRLDVIIDQISESLKRRWGFDPRENPQSYLNVLITDFADKIAELWEFGEQVYWSQYPSSAEGINLDNVAQYGGITREPGTKSIYHVLCTGTDGLEVPIGTRIRSDRNPTTVLRCIGGNDSTDSSGLITRAKFNRVRIKESGQQRPYSVFVQKDGADIESAAGSTLLELVNNWPGTFEQIDVVENGVTRKEDDPTRKTTEHFKLSVENDILQIAALDSTASYSLTLYTDQSGDALTTVDVSTILRFATVDDGDIYLPEGTITIIVDGVRTDNGSLNAVENVGEYSPGQLIETDSELRKSYADKIFLRSYSMVESIKSAVLSAVPELTHCAVYQNDTNETDEAGRPPHSVEVLVSGIATDDEENKQKVAQAILDTKAAGITTFGDVEIEVAANDNDTIPIRFNFPERVTIYFKIYIDYDGGITDESKKEEIRKAIRASILTSMAGLGVGDDVNPQRWIPQVDGVTYLDIYVGKPNQNGQPIVTSRLVRISERQQAWTEEGNINFLHDA